MMRTDAYAQIGYKAAAKISEVSPLYSPENMIVNGLSYAKLKQYAGKIADKVAENMGKLMQRNEQDKKYTSKLDGMLGLGGLNPAYEMSK